MVTPIDLAESEVGGVNWATDTWPCGVLVPRSTRQHRPVKLVLEDEKQVFEHIDVELGAGEPVWGDVKVGPCTITQ